MSQEEKDPTYVHKDECNVCEQKPGQLHLWHCVFRDPYHYQDSDGSEVSELRPKMLKVIWQGEVEGPIEKGMRVKLYEDGSVEPAWDSPTSCCKAMEQLGAVLAEVLKPAKLHVIECVRQGKHLKEMEGEDCKSCGRNINFLLGTQP